MLTATIIGILSVPLSVLWNNSLNKDEGYDTSTDPRWTGTRNMKYVPIIGLLSAIGRYISRPDTDDFGY